jgi:hypothetical protein
MIEHSIFDCVFLLEFRFPPLRLVINVLRLLLEVLVVFFRAKRPLVIVCGFGVMRSLVM